MFMSTHKQKHVRQEGMRLFVADDSHVLRECLAVLLEVEGMSA